MNLDRDDLAARFAVAIAGGLSADSSVQTYDHGVVIEDAFDLADALIARLRPATVAPVADAAPRPEWVRLSGDFRLPLERKVVRWEGHQPVVMHSSGLSELAPLVGGEWEPCAAPAPSPAAAPDHPTAASFAARRGQGAVGDQHPAAYVPKCGDVVRFRIYGKNDPGAGVVTGVGVDAATIVAFGEDPTNDKPWCRYFRDCVYARPATAAERAAAGLPPITPDHPQGGQGAAGDQRVAAGLDAPAFDEASERETAVDIAKDRGLDVAEEVGFVAGWLARARIAAKGGAS